MEWLKTLDSFMLMLLSLPFLALACGVGLMYLEWKYPSDDDEIDTSASTKMLI
jgi:hypothetical protein